MLDKKRGEILEAAAVKGIVAVLHTELTVADAELLISELPNILKLNYPEVKDILNSCMVIISNLLIMYRNSIENQYNWKVWNKYAQYNSLLNMLKVFNR